MAEFSKEIKAYALKNAIEFGKADSSKILPKLFQHGLEKEGIKNIMPQIKKIVEEVNALTLDERNLLFANYEAIVKVKEEKTNELLSLSQMKKGKKPIFRAAPFPSGALHLGNAKIFILNALYAEKYKGKLLLIMDDTIGSAEKPIDSESYALIEDAFKWLKIKYQSPIIYKSDRMKIYYKYAIELIKKDKAYVCHCNQEELRKNRAEGKACGCRILPKNLQLLRWKEMFNMREGEAILRIKTDMLHPNPAFRDRVLFKISERPHPRIGNKCKVWPTLEMSMAIDDHLLKITHIIRGSDLLIETDMEKFIWDIFKWKHPEIFHAGFVNIEGVQLHKSKAQKEIKSGEFTGWDDPRTWSIQSLRRRGIKPEAIREFVKEIGLNKQNTTVPIDALYAINRKLIDSSANRYSFIFSPLKLQIQKKPDWKEISIPIHPDKTETRKINLGDIYISEQDFNEFKNREIRLLHLFNIKLGKTQELTSIDNRNIPKINWVSSSVPARILTPGGAWIEGIADEGITTLKHQETIQFERFGFVTFDKKTKSKDKTFYDFWFAHK